MARDGGFSFAAEATVLPDGTVLVGGAAWERLLRFGGHRLLVDPRDPDIVYGGNLFGFFVSRDAGETKARRGVPPLDIGETEWHDVYDFAAGPRGADLRRHRPGAPAQRRHRLPLAPARRPRPAREPGHLPAARPHDPGHWLLRSFDDLYATEAAGSRPWSSTPSPQVASSPSSGAGS